MKDLFSHKSPEYARYRPVYSDEMYEFLFSLPDRRNQALDAATGNGQVARVLATKFRHVYASDISKAQLNEAPKLQNVDYMQAPAEKLPVPDGKIDLLTVAQAIHWFNIAKFEEEAWRILRPNGVLCYWGYALGELSDRSWNDAFHEFYQSSLHYWHPEREIVDNHYSSIRMNRFSMNLRSFTLKIEWTSDHLLNYIQTWSAFPDMVMGLGQDVLKPLFSLKPESFIITFPVFLYYGRKA